MIILWAFGVNNIGGLSILAQTNRYPAYCLTRGQDLMTRPRLIRITFQPTTYLVYMLLNKAESFFFKKKKKSAHYWVSYTARIVLVIVLQLLRQMQLMKVKKKICIVSTTVKMNFPSCFYFSIKVSNIREEKGTVGK